MQERLISERNARLGRWFFATYALIYLLFVLVNAFWPHMMEQTPVAGISLAVTSGVALILFAFVLALVFGFVCRDSNDTRGQHHDV